MAIYCVTYDLKTPGTNYESVHNYLKKFNHCKKLESFWLIDTATDAANIRDDLGKLIDDRDIIFVAELQRHWASTHYLYATWLTDEPRNWE